MMPFRSKPGGFLIRPGPATLIAALCLGIAGPTFGQAPIRERSDQATPVEAARRAADAARQSLEDAERRSSAADARTRRAAEALKAARAEDEAARAEKAAAAKALADARRADADARAGLGKVLETPR